ncbi:HD-GYP domain-containing protein [Blastopirellula retiformator]|uniref:Cyclic di-GMP phosphodiesterase response regulator RpfG n=1 Tax=Blastopirellula retiformator TaxID=2527970 RepID=A0A5C5UXA9_9BACT|nr:HD domain-containing phosphohydrolase [Blastopirellula retiformator]TWT30025.1 Cyclic di-GMP phosphodiesterase response regulator RpfG [Blastopirellula retiformator]
MQRPSEASQAESDSPSALEFNDREMRQKRIIAIDDEPVNLALAEAYLRHDGFERLEFYSDPQTALEVVRNDPPDLILLDLMMPKLDGLNFLKAIETTHNQLLAPVILLTASSDTEHRREALELGGADFLQKPILAEELIPRIRNVLSAQHFKTWLRDQNQRLEQLVQHRTKELERAQGLIIACLARAAEFRDELTGHHNMRVARYAGLIARNVGLPGELVRTIQAAAPLHDIGKVAVPDSILHKPGRLTPEERSLMERHTDWGRSIVEPEKKWGFIITDLTSGDAGQANADLLRVASRIAMSHHERWDGAGYPQGLAGTDIPVEARVVSVADVFDALSCKRPYKDAFPPEKCLAMIREQRGKQFDPDMVDAFEEAIPEVLWIQEILRDEAQ